MSNAFYQSNTSLLTIHYYVWYWKQNHWNTLWTENDNMFMKGNMYIILSQHSLVVQQIPVMCVFIFIRLSFLLLLESSNITLILWTNTKFFMNEVVWTSCFHQETLWSSLSCVRETKHKHFVCELHEKDGTYSIQEY